MQLNIDGIPNQAPSSDKIMPQTDRSHHSTLDKRFRRHVIGRVRQYHVITIPGFETLCHRELSGLGIAPDQMKAEPGGVTFSGRFVDCQKANLHLHTATRVLMRIDEFTVTNTRQLEKKAAAIPWELFLPKGQMPDFRIRSRRSRLYHTKAIYQSLSESIHRRIGVDCDAPSPTKRATVYARAIDDRFVLSMDSSGVPLYKRGVKEGKARAPIRETLAAAVLMSAGYDCRRPLVDPMCGAGTFSLEAAMMAKQMAPGIGRRFAFMDWPAFRVAPWNFLRRSAEAGMQKMPQHCIFASDVDPVSCNRLEGTVAGSGFEDAVRIRRQDFFTCHGKAFGDKTGLVVINPPYGIRLSSKKQAEKLFVGICRHLAQAFGGWNVALIVPQRQWIGRLPFPARQISFPHGGLKLTLLVGTVP